MARAVKPTIGTCRPSQVVPAEGIVWPGSEVEVIVQFYPDYTTEYEEMAYVEVQVRSPKRS